MTREDLEQVAVDFTESKLIFEWFDEYGQKKEVRKAKKEFVAARRKFWRAVNKYTRSK